MDYLWNFQEVHVTPYGGMSVLGHKGAVWTFEGKEIGMWLLKTDDEWAR